MSNHLTCLRGCGLVVGTPEGRQMRYELADRHLAHALADLVEVVLAVDTAQPCLPIGGPDHTDASGPAKPARPASRVPR